MKKIFSLLLNFFFFIKKNVLTQEEHWVQLHEWGRLTYLVAIFNPKSLSLSCLTSFPWDVLIGCLCISILFINWIELV